MLIGRGIGGLIKGGMGGRGRNIGLRLGTSVRSECEMCMDGGGDRRLGLGTRPGVC